MADTSRIHTLTIDCWNCSASSSCCPATSLTSFTESWKDFITVNLGSTKLNLQLLNQPVKEVKPCTPLSDNLWQSPFRFYSQTSNNMQSIRWIYIGHHVQGGRHNLFFSKLVRRPLIPKHGTELEQYIVLILSSALYKKRSIYCILRPIY